MVHGGRGRVDICTHVVVAFEGTAIKLPEDLFRELDKYNVGDRVKVTVKRGDKRVTVKLKLSDIGN